MAKPAKVNPAIALILQALLAYSERDPISDSDLDDEQPITLTVHTRLGVMRALDRKYG